tara:strand:+ start:288 stop:830 length:543 start_codon:yes stop_codon:yes gene_type:complete
MAIKLSKTTMNMAYGLGAAIVIIGALMKIIHADLDLGLFVIKGNTLLTIGLVTEALIFALSAFEAPDKDFDWSKVYPELDGGPSTGNSKESTQGLLSKKLDTMLKEAKLDASLFSSLTTSIKDMEASAKSGASSADELAKINKEFAENANNLQKQMGALASNLESLNSVYGGVLGAMSKK